MAFMVQLRTEQGAVLDEFILAGLPVDRVPVADDASSAVLRFIDTHGDTILNAAQARALVLELSEVRFSDEAAAERLVAIAERCAAGVHQYLWFVGD
jgi:hypothetical protein